MPRTTTEFRHPPLSSQNAVLAIHGSASSGRQWKALAEQPRGTTHVHAPDLPGYGTSAADSGERLEALARIVKQHAEGVHLSRATFPKGYRRNGAPYRTHAVPSIGHSPAGYGPFRASHSSRCSERAPPTRDPEQPNACRVSRSLNRKDTMMITFIGKATTPLNTPDYCEAMLQGQIVPAIRAKEAPHVT